MKRTVYLDTTIPNYYFDEREALKKFGEITRTWWQEERHNFNVWISNETLAELGEGVYPHKQEALEFAARLPVLPPDENIPEIAQIYIDNYLMPRVLKGDALHLAYASFYKIDFLLTWNCNHLANANKKQHIRRINTRLNLSIPEIVTPLELFTEANDAY
jgi:predicted nucleic acid-binding protein